MSNRQDHDLIQDMIEAARRSMRYCKDLDYEGFLQDTKTQDAVVRNVEIIGEAAGKISPDLRNQYPDLPWNNIIGMRNRLVHDYFGVNLNIVWEVVATDLPDLTKWLNRILDDSE